MCLLQVILDHPMLDRTSLFVRWTITWFRTAFCQFAKSLAKILNTFFNIHKGKTILILFIPHLSFVATLLHPCFIHLLKTSASKGTVVCKSPKYIL